MLITPLGMLITPLEIYRVCIVRNAITYPLETLNTATANKSVREEILFSSFESFNTKIRVQTGNHEDQDVRTQGYSSHMGPTSKDGGFIIRSPYLR